MCSLPPAEWVYRNRSMGWGAMSRASGLGVTVDHFRKRMNAAGYKKDTAGRWLTVPCRACGTAIKAGEYWTCPICPVPAGAEPWGDVPEWKVLYERELARVLEKREAETERVKAWIRERMAKKPTHREMVGIMAPRDAA